MARTPTAEALPALSVREREVFLRLANGESIETIAKTLKLHPSTVSTYRGRIVKKTGLANEVKMAHFAIARRLLRASAR
jgi:two-component system invasion response regulator UvrY